MARDLDTQDPCYAVVQPLQIEVKSLRAENEELKRVLALVSRAGRDDNAENERLRRAFNDQSQRLQLAHAENERLKSLQWPGPL